MKKWGFIVLALGSVLWLASCSKDNSGVITVNFWDWFVTQGPTIDKEIELFEAAHPGIKIKKTTTQFDSYINVFSLAQSADNGPDVFMIPDPRRIPLQDEVAKGWLKPISDYPDYPDFAKTFPPYSFAEGVNMVAGKTYTAPFEGAAPWLQLWINTKVFKDAGLVDSKGEILVPRTLDDVVNFSRIIKKKSNGQVYGYGFGAKQGTGDWYWWWTQYSGAPNDWAGLNPLTGHYEYSKRPAVRKLLDTLVLMKKEQLVLPQALSIDDETARANFARGKFGMLTGGTWIINGWRQTDPTFKDYTAVPLPLVGVTQPSSYFYLAPGGTPFLGIGSKTQHPKEAWLWYRWIYSKEAGARWVKAGNGMSVFPEANAPQNVDNPAMAKVFAMSSLTRLGPQVGIRNPETLKVHISAVKPDEAALVAGIFTGQVADVGKALQELDASKETALDQAISDAVKSGAKVSRKDWIFSDWNPTKDYAPKY